MSSAQLDIQQPEGAGFDEHAAPAAPFALKQQAAERIAAHRARRQKTSPAPATSIALAPSPAKARAARIAAAVAERYARSPSYRAVFAAEAEKAIQQAQAAANIAALNAQAVADAQYSLLAELDQLTPPEPLPPIAQPHTPPHLDSDSARHPTVFANPTVTPTASRVPAVGVTVRLLEDFIDHGHDLAESFTNSQALASPDPLDDESLALDDEIAFRQSPVFEPATPPQEIPANLIEFPRQLVAARRARPRLAEGPLRDSVEPKADAAQLRIFEVEATQISTAPVSETSATEWSSILLDAYPVSPSNHTPHAADYAPHYPQESPEERLAYDLPPQAAPFSLRLMASAVDGCIILSSFVAFTAAFALTAGTLTTEPFNLQATALAAAVILIFLAVSYHLLFFTFSGATPGMRYARIGLCTFRDENPSRSAMRRRVFALMLSICPLGIGILWAWLDPDRLGWHDRISRMYQRSY